MRKRINLNYKWLFSKYFEEEHLVDFKNTKDFEEVNLPHTNHIIALNNFDERQMQIISCYKKEIAIDKEDEGKIFELIFEGSAHMTTIYVNDEFVTIHKGGYDRFVVDISQFVKFAENNMITVVVDATENQNIPPFGGTIDYLCYGGLYREVYLDISDEKRIIDCFFKTPNASKSITAYCEITVDYTPIELELTVYDGAKIVSTNKYNINRELETIDFDVKERKLWTIDNPYLYTAKLKISADGKLLDEAAYRFAFREVEFQKDGVYLNKEKIKVIGLNRHQCYPYVGYAMPKSAQEKDAEILKYELGVNTVRTSHYMQSPHFLNRCDEIGLLVIEEIPGWQHIGDVDFKNNTVANVEAMIRRDRNHPAIIAWGVRINESFDDRQLYTKTNQVAHDLDSTRPTCGIRYLIDSDFLEDVFTFNDFTYDGGKKVIAKPKKTPHLITEHNGHMYPTKRYDDEQHRTEQTLRHLKVINEANGQDSVVGAIGWCMHDYNTHKDFGSGDKVCYHGVLDMFRIPKLASAAYQSQNEGSVFLQVSSSMAKGDYPASQLDKFYVFTNCEYVKMFKNNDYVATFYPDKVNYPNLAHPPVVIDDKIGCLLEKHEKLKASDAAKVKKIFKAVDKHGFNISIFMKITILFIMLKYKLKRKQIINMYFKYNGSSPNHELVYRFDGYSNENVVKTVAISDPQILQPVLKIDNSKLTVKDTYDVTRVVVEVHDQNGLVVPYFMGSLNITVDGGIDLIGPNAVAVVGGVAGFYVKTNQKAKDGIITVNIMDQVIKQNVKINIIDDAKAN